MTKLFCGFNWRYPIWDMTWWKSCRLIKARWYVQSDDTSKTSPMPSDTLVVSNHNVLQGNSRLCNLVPALLIIHSHMYQLSLFPSEISKIAVTSSDHTPHKRYFIRGNYGQLGFSFNIYPTWWGKDCRIEWAQGPQFFMESKLVVSQKKAENKR